MVGHQVPYVHLLTNAERTLLWMLTARFLREKRFEAAGGAKLSDRSKLTIAAQACLLQLGIGGPLFPTLRTVIVYPGAYRAHDTIRRPEGVEIELSQVRAGESWDYGTMVLSWRDVVRGTADPASGHNVVLHEFAHQLDEETGETNGAPSLPDKRRYRSWQAAFRRGFERLQLALEAGQDPSPFIKYASTSPAEYFAIATELFFERPRALHLYDDELFQQLRGFYQQDPRSRFVGE
jgi:Mlc titration factor MtfA (ptsG expression regulator)